MKIQIKPVLSYNEVQMYTACNLSVPDADITKMNDAIKAPEPGAPEAALKGCRFRRKNHAVADPRH